MMSQMGEATGRADMAQQYSRVFANIRAAFQKEYVKSDGTVEPERRPPTRLHSTCSCCPPQLERPAVDKPG